MFKVVVGDLFKSKADVIIHGANCCGKMFSGVAGIVRELYPEAIEADLKTPNGDMDKLGSYSFWTGKHVAYPQEITVVNAYTQFYPGKDGKLEAIDSAFKLIKKDFPNKSIAFPAIGAGIAGLSIEEVFEVMQKNFKDHTNPVELYILPTDPHIKFFWKLGLIS